MYLHATRYESNYKFQIAENGENETFKTILQTVGGYVSPEVPSVEVSLTIGYWRKVNAIHNWFINELADGKDECQRIYADRSELERLSETCKAVLADNSLAEKLLPTGAGFFFGGTEYDEWYFEGLKNTVAQIKEALALGSNWGFYYQASW